MDKSFFRGEALTSIILDTRRALVDGSYPVRIRITHKRKQVYFKTPYNLSKEQFNMVMGKNPKNDNKKIALDLQSKETNAANIIQNLKPFTWDGFKKNFGTDRIENNTLENSFNEYIKKLNENNQLGSVEIYVCAKNSLKDFSPNARLTDVTVDFLRKYEKWMLDKGRSITTVGMYIRNLRTIINLAISEKLIPIETYPFGKRKYEIPTGENIKKAVSYFEIDLIKNYIPKNAGQQKARDLWLFSFFCFGMNMKDIFLLKYKNMKGEDFFEFERAKTIRTKRKALPIRVGLRDEAKEIIKRHGVKPCKPENYIFPILKNGLSAIEERKAIKQATKTVNEHMKNISKELKIKESLNTYTARHSMATHLQRDGKPTSFIQKALGHGSIVTTERYLAGFQDEMIMEASKSLSSYKKDTK